jgi:hypothetical protein
MRLRHLRLVEEPAMQTPEQHAQQRAWVEMAERLSRFSRERRDEASAQARLYARPRARVENVVPLHPRTPEPPAAA